MQKEKVNTIKYPASLDTKLDTIKRNLGLSSRELLERMVDYFHRTKKDPRDVNDELLKNTLLKNHRAYTGFIKAQEQLLLVPIKEAMDKLMANQREIVRYFNEQVIGANKQILKQQAQLERKMLEAVEGREKLKADFLQLLGSYIQRREELGAFKGRDRELLAEETMDKVKKL
ncbi:MAG: hypothetical protein JNL13_01330 [Chitinophagaceae bacterium]|nr:hypothetical protein [Chitinophagaceae bacterium]